MINSIILFMEYYSGIKRNEVLLRAAIGVNLESNMLSERSQSQIRCWMISFL